MSLSGVSSASYQCGSPQGAQLRVPHLPQEVRSADTCRRAHEASYRYGDDVTIMSHVEIRLKSDYLDGVVNFLFRSFRTSPCVTITLPNLTLPFLQEKSRLFATSATTASSSLLTSKDTCSVTSAHRPNTATTKYRYESTLSQQFPCFPLFSFPLDHGPEIMKPQTLDLLEASARCASR